MRPILLCLFCLSIVVPTFSVTEKSDASKEYIEKTYREALSLFNKKDYEGSLNKIRHVIKSDMHNFKLRYLAAYNHWMQQHYDSATVHFQVAASVNNLYAGTYIDRALMYLEQNNLYRAREIAKYGIEFLNTKDQKIPARLYHTLALIELKSGNINNALSLAQRAKSVASSLDKIEAMKLEARAYLLKKNFEDAELSLNWALKLSDKADFNSSSLKNLLGLTYELWANTSKNAKSKKTKIMTALSFYRAAAALSNSSEKKIIQNNIVRLSP